MSTQQQIIKQHAVIKAIGLVVFRIVI